MSSGSETCTGPRRPEVAIWMASPIERAMRDGLSTVQDALVKWLASSACGISWKPPRPRFETGA